MDIEGGTTTAKAPAKPWYRRISKKVWVILAVVAGVVILTVLLFWWLNTRPLYLSGKLLGPEGKPLADGSYQLRVRLFDVVNDARLVFDQTLQTDVRDAEYSLSVKPSKDALTQTDLAVICLYNAAETDPESGLPACQSKDAAETDKADAVVCEPFVVEKNALNWNNVLTGANKVSQNADEAYCDDDPKATYGPKLSLSRLQAKAEAAGLTKQQLDEFGQRLESGDYADVTEQYITEQNITEGGGVQSVTASGVMQSSGGVNPVITLKNGDGVGQILQWDGIDWQIVTPQSSGLPTSCVNTQAVCNKGNKLGGVVSIGTQDSQKLQFLTNNQVRLTINEQGFTGFGTDDPTSMFTINGNLKVLGPNFLTFVAGTGTKILFNDAQFRSQLYMEDGYGLIYRAGQNSTANSGRHVFAVSGGNGTWAERFRVNGLADGANAATFSTPGGTGCTVVTGTGWSCSSDERLKKQIRPITNGLDVVKALDGVTFLWKNGEPTPQAGFIAQDVEKVLPHLVQTGPDGYKTLNQNEIVPYLVQAVQEQQRQIDELRQELLNLR